MTKRLWIIKLVNGKQAEWVVAENGETQPTAKYAKKYYTKSGAEVFGGMFAASKGEGWSAIVELEPESEASELIPSP